LAALLQGVQADLARPPVFLTSTHGWIVKADEVMKSTECCRDALNDVSKGHMMKVK